MKTIQDIDKPILVTGATGRQGGTGLGVVRALRKLGLPVRALVRTEDERAERLRTLGAEVFKGDFMDYRSLLEMLQGVEAAYFCYPVAAGSAEAAGMFSAAGRQTGLKRIVDLSLGNTNEYAASPQVRAQWVVERIFEWAGFDGVHLRVNAFFMENIALLDSGGVKRDKRVANAFGDFQIGWIAGEDVGAVAAALLVDHSLTTDRVLELGGVEHQPYPHVAAILSEVLGERIRYEELTPEQWREELLARSTAAGRPNPRGADHLSAQVKSMRSQSVAQPVTDQVEDLTGKEAISMRQFLERRRKEFMPSAQ